MSIDPEREAKRARLSREFDKALAKLGRDPEFQKGVHFNVPAKNNPLLQALNQAEEILNKKKVH